MKTKDNKKELFQHGPLYEQRFNIVESIKGFLRTGDILYRYSNAKGPLFLPFTKLVSIVTKSNYSHSALIYMEDKEPYVLEVNDQGTIKYRLIDWLDTCYNNNFCIYRLKDLDDQKEARLFEKMQVFFNKDPDYDFTFSDVSKFYCTESVIFIYKEALNIELDPGYYLKDILKGWRYQLFKIGNSIFSFFGTSLPLDKKLYFVGNESQGMLSSKYTKLIFKNK